jgi:hypothetical protein
MAELRTYPEREPAPRSDWRYDRRFATSSHQKPSDCRQLRATADARLAMLRR